MILKLGVGIATYNRRDLALAAVRQVIEHTEHPFALVVADDGSTDGTAQAFRDQRITVVGGPNMGTAWNKNRALFFLAEILQCDIVILLEDDTAPILHGWERAWMIGAGRHGMVHLVPEDLSADGKGSTPGLMAVTSIRSDCAAYTREALLFAGYMDSRMTGCGWENVEHAQQLRRAGYGGGSLPASAASLFYLALPPDGLRSRTCSSYVTDADFRRNRALAADPTARAVRRTPPWHDQESMRQFRDEMAVNAARLASQTERPIDVVQPAPRIQAVATGSGPEASLASSRPRKLRAGG